LRLVEAVAARGRAVSRNGNGNWRRARRVEIAIDLRRAGDGTLDQALQTVLAGGAATTRRAWCSSRGARQPALIWGFNALYWKALNLWEQATGRGYEQALPGGESDARNVAAARELILELFGVWDRLAERKALPEELHVLELGVGNGNQARVWLDQFRRLDAEMGREYYRRLHYLMGDYSPHVLNLARKAVAQHGEKVSSLVLDAMRPTETLAARQGVPGLHLERLRQLADRRNCAHWRPSVPGAAACRAAARGGRAHRRRTARRQAGRSARPRPAATATRTGASGRGAV
jgi:hypothetical protein